MEIVTVVFIGISFIIVSVYCITVLKWNFYFRRGSSINYPAIANYKTFISVIIPFRNEEINIIECLQSLMLQDYPYDKFEIILSDDHSEDKSAEKIRLFLENNQEPFPKIILIKQESESAVGKKAALENAINKSSGELIITSDADCTADKGWVSSYARIYEHTGAGMITGLVILSPLTSFFSKLQALDVLSLSGSGAASVLSGKPLMCNGANLAFKKSVFEQAGGYSYGAGFPSGDDTFLMLKISAMQNIKLIVNTEVGGIVSTKPSKSFFEILMQRKRWSSKVKHYKENYIWLTGVLIFFSNFFLLLLAMGIFFQWCSIASFLVIFLVKMICDFIFINSITGHVKQRQLLMLFLPAIIIYPLYMLIGAILSVIKVKFKWKNRVYHQ